MSPSVATAARPRMARELTMLLLVAAIWAAFAGLAPSFLSPRNLSMLAIELSITAVLALGMLLVILPGHIDLSAGSGVGLAGGVASVLVFHHGWPAPAAALLVLLVCAIVWRAMGAVIVLQHVPAFIITLGGLLVFKGLHLLVIANQTVPVARGGQENLLSVLTTYYLPPPAGLALAALVIGTLALGRWRELREPDRTARELAWMKLIVAAQLVLLFVLVCNAYRGVPLSALILGLVAMLMHVLTQHTRFGRYLYAIGGNEEAARVSGVPVQRVLLGAFTAMGVVVAITGFLQTAYAGASTTTVGELMELDAVAACVIGGTSLRGGRGSVMGVLAGSLVMTSLLNGMTLMAVSPEVKSLVRGLVLAIAVWVDVRVSMRGR